MTYDDCKFSIDSACIYKELYRELSATRPSAEKSNVDCSSGGMALLEEGTATIETKEPKITGQNDTLKGLRELLNAHSRRINELEASLVTITEMFAGNKIAMNEQQIAKLKSIIEEISKLITEQITEIKNFVGKQETAINTEDLEMFYRQGIIERIYLLLCHFNDKEKVTGSEIMLEAKNNLRLLLTIAVTEEDSILNANAARINIELPTASTVDAGFSAILNILTSQGKREEERISEGIKYITTIYQSAMEKEQDNRNYAIEHLDKAISALMEFKKTISNNSTRINSKKVVSALNLELDKKLSVLQSLLNFNKSGQEFRQKMEDLLP